MKKAGFSQQKTFREYDERLAATTFTESLTLEALKDLVFMERNENVMMLGSVGTGKSHLAVATGLEACKQGKNVRFFRVSDLVSLLLEKHQNGTLTRFMREMKKVELLILDELGFIPFHKDGSELLFDLISECYETASVIITTNLEFGQWNTVFGDKRLTAAIIDRLVHHAHILSFTGESYRLTHALSKQKPQEEN
ncbi:IS21-like element helper ATPase IstB [Paenibacillus yanchengensis]|uniref:IS21-like element helper ATPase IstB n=1 Tax=Paenibacillus yanchengensis TaxID=2035833 RepID=A0ABW4YPK8_9BACL